MGPVAAVAGILLTAFLVVAPADAPVAAASPPTVQIVDFAFQPSTITVTAGETVTWANAGATTHTVTADDGSFDSGSLDPGNRFANLFDKPGTYTYHCSIHSSMHGTVIVKAAPATPVSTGPATPSPPPGTLPPDFSPHPVQTPPPLPSSAPASLSATASAPPNGSEAPGSPTGTDSGGAVVIVGLLIVVGIAGIALVALIARASRRR